MLNVFFCYWTPLFPLKTLIDTIHILIYFNQLKYQNRAHSSTPNVRNTAQTAPQRTNSEPYKNSTGVNSTTIIRQKNTHKDRKAFLDL